MAEIVVMPKMNLTMEEGVLVEWGKKVGRALKSKKSCAISKLKSRWQRWNHLPPVCC